MTRRRLDPDAAAAAATAYATAITDRVHAATGSRLDIRDLNAHLDAAWRTAGYGHAVGGLLEAGRAVGLAWSNLLRRVETSGAVLSPMTKRRVLAPLANVERLADAALSGYDPTELDAARERLEDLRSELAAGQAALEAAVNAGDVEGVMSLRSEVEVTRTSRVADAELAVADLEIAAAETQACRPRERARAAAAAAADAEQHLEDARTALAKAEADAVSARQAADRTADAAAAADSRVRDLAATRADIAERARVDRATRLRRLAGLPVHDYRVGVTR